MGWKTILETRLLGKDGKFFYSGHRVEAGSGVIACETLLMELIPLLAEEFKYIILKQRKGQLEQ